MNKGDIKNIYIPLNVAIKTDKKSIRPQTSETLTQAPKNTLPL
jgi:hypothetical protein